MKLVRIGAGVLNQTPLDWDGNRRNILTAIDRARAAGVTVLCLPELCISGYGCEDAFHSRGVHDQALESLAQIVPASAGMIVSVGLPLYHNKALYNAACLLVDGRIAGFVCKRFLAGDGIHYEPRWFKPWPDGQRSTVEVGEREYPVGDLYFEVAGIKIGFEICEDAWVASRPGSQLALKGVDILLNPSASHFAFGKHEIRKRFVIEGSRAFGVAYVYSNLLGNEAGRIIYDGGAIIANAGEMIVSGDRFSWDDVNLTSAVVDIAANRMIQSRTSSFRPDVDDQAVDVAFELPDILPVVNTDPEEPWERQDRVKEEEFSRAVALGLYDYLRKSRSHGFVVSLSGGADSAAVSCLVALTAALGIASIGRDAFLAKLSYIDGLDGAADTNAIVGRLLTCVYQATRNSGEVTETAAREVATALGADYMRFDVDALVTGYTDLVSGGIGRELSWEQDDLALQNIQARARAPSVWMLANLRRALLLATSNRSEAAVGYATMDGDTCGGLSPIAGIDKAFLRQWLRWMETEGPAGVDPVPALSFVNVQQPTAELRPPSANQTDESDLMPYELLDAIEGAAIRDKHTPLEVYLEMRVQFLAYSPQQLCTYIERFFLLWCRNQWKRERYAPSFHVDDKNLDPKTWCRFPILSGGYRKELADMRVYVRSNEEPL